MQFLHRDSTTSSSHVVQIAFTGKGLPQSAPERRGESIGSLLPEGVESACVEQVHSADVVHADSAGCYGPADAMVTRRSGLALAVVTADCVPILLAGRGQIAAIHAGWRGVVGGIVAEAAARFEQPPCTAWIGPAISADVYEVGDEVASWVAAVSTDSVKSVGAGGREHVDLRRAVEVQLHRVGVEDVRQVERCTFSNPSLWSYRRDGAKAGRNLSVIWMMLRS